MSGWGGNDFDINPMCPCGKKLHDKKVTEFSSVTFNLYPGSGSMSWVCNRVNQSRCAVIQPPYLLGYLRCYISIAKIITTREEYINNKPQDVSKAYFLVPEEIENKPVPYVMNIL